MGAGDRERLWKSGWWVGPVYRTLRGGNGEPGALQNWSCQIPPVRAQAEVAGTQEAMRLLSVRDTIACKLLILVQFKDFTFLPKFHKGPTPLQGRAGWP